MSLPRKANDENILVKVLSTLNKDDQFKQWLGAQPQS